MSPVQSHHKASNHLSPLYFSTLSSLAQGQRPELHDVKKLSCTISLFPLVSAAFIIFLTSRHLLLVTLPAYTLHRDTPPSSMLPMQLAWLFNWGTTSVLFTWGNRCVSCYATNIWCMSTKSLSQYPTFITILFSLVNIFSAFSRTLSITLYNVRCQYTTKYKRTIAIK